VQVRQQLAYLASSFGKYLPKRRISLHHIFGNTDFCKASASKPILTKTALSLPKIRTIIKMMQRRAFSFICLVQIALATAALGQKKITLEECFINYKFYPSAVDGYTFLPNGRQYTILEADGLHLYDVEKQDFDTLLWPVPSQIGAEAYHLSANGKALLLTANKIPIYRHSYTANYTCLQAKSNTPIAVGGKDARLQVCALSPDGTQALYVKDNNLYYQSFANQGIVQVTKDGEKNKIINGLPDWVYEEEFSEVNGEGLTAASWSPNGSQIAYIRFDETLVQEFKMTSYLGEMYPEITQFKYPKVGTPNAQVSVHIYDTKKNQSKEVYTGQPGDRYLPRIKWTPDQQLVVTRLNRHQDTLQLYICKPNFETNDQILPSRLLLTETDSAYVELGHIDYLTFLKDHQHFIWASERSGSCQLYLYTMAGKLARQITSDKNEVTNFYGIDEQNQLLYLQTTYSPFMRMVWEVPLDAKAEARIMSAEAEGYHEAQFSPTFSYWIHKSQNSDQPPQYTMRRRTGTIVNQLMHNSDALKQNKDYGFVKKEFMQIPMNHQYKINAWMIRPPNFDETKKYPVLVDIYGGPGSQNVSFAYDGYLDPWRQMLAQKGYIVVVIDNRGTGARGRDFKKITQMQLGKIETEDQIQAARYLAALPWVDPSRIGIWGWSFGGFLSTNCLLKGNDVYKLAVAVAPVTNWKWYDTAYTERYLHTYAENPKGYDDNSPINFADRLKGKYLLCHGMADDNVHWQHSVEMTDALIKAGKQFETYYYPNRNHGIYGDNATIHLFTKITNFILENL
jgi:dipeptidyl-peptidase 4